MEYLQFCLGFLIGNCIPHLVLGLIALFLAKNNKNFYPPLLIGVSIEVIDSLGRLFAKGFSAYSFLAMLLSFLILLYFYKKAKDELL